MDTHLKNCSLARRHDDRIQVFSQPFLNGREKSEKRTMNPAPSPSVSSGVARVPPTTHINPIQNIRGNHATGKGVPRVR